MYFIIDYLKEYVVSLTEVVIQNNKLLIDLLNKVRADNIDDNVEKLLKARFIHEFDEN